MHVDVHAHLMPAAAFQRLPVGMTASVDGDNDRIALNVSGRGTGRGAPRVLRDLTLHRQLQADRGIDVTIVGPWVDMVKAPGDAATQDAWCRVINDELAAAVSGIHHSRFLAALPDLDGGRAAEELARAAELGAVGGMLAANPERGTLARDDLSILWRTAEHLGRPIVLHPGEFKPPERLQPFFMVNLVGNPFETTLAVGCLIGARVPERFPDLRLVLVHGGGFFPYQYGRFDHGFAHWPTLRGGNHAAPSEYLRWFHYDTVLFDGVPLRYLLDVVGPARVLAGSDCPFTMTDDRPFIAPAELGLSRSEETMVTGENARDLFALSEG